MKFTPLKGFFAFMNNVFTSRSNVSHKRLIAFGSFLALCAMVVIKAKGWPIDKTLVIVFATLCGGQSTLAVIEKYGRNGNNGTDKPGA